jgi:hypothetical protein
MSINTGVPDYALSDRKVVSAPAEIRALADPLRTTLLDLVLERAATVAELAAAVGRPKSTIAYHVNVLVGVGMLRVVRTRRVRAIDERFYGRTARVFMMGPAPLDGMSPPPWSNYLADAAAESMPSYQADTMFAILRHARVTRPRAVEFWARVEDLVREFSALPREGDTVFGFVTGLYPTDHPSLPDAPPNATEDETTS